MGIFAKMTSFMTKAIKKRQRKMTELFDAIGILFLYSITFIVVGALCASCIFLAIDACRKPKEGPLPPYKAPH